MHFATNIFRICLVGWLLAGGLVFSAAGQDKLAEARQSYEAGWLALQNEQYSFALEKLEKARRAFAEAGQWAQYLDSGTAQSLALSRMGQSTEALTLAKKLEMEFLPKLDSRSLSEAALGNALGEIYLKNGRNDLAQDYFQKALDLYTTSFPDQHQAIADCYDNLSLVLWNAQHQERALEFAFKALYLREAVPANGEAKMAASYNNIGLIYSQSGDYPKAKAYYLKALAIYQVIYEANHPKIANALNNLGIIEWQQALFSEAIPYFEKALAIYLQKYGPEHPNVAFVYAYLGQVYLGQQDFVKALGFAQQALHIYQKNYAEKHPEVAKTYNLLGSIHLQNKAYKEAQVFFQKALRANLPAYDSQDIAATPALRDYYDANVLLNSLRLKAQALETEHVEKTLRMRNLHLALASLVAADELVEEIRKSRTHTKDKIELGNTAAEVYEEAIRICLLLAEKSLFKQAYWEKAFYFCEKSKSAVLLAAIQETNAKAYADIPADILEEEKALKAEITLIERQLADRPPAEEEKNLREQLFALKNRYQDFVNHLEKQYEKYYNLKFNPKMVSVAEIQQSLNEKTALVSYFVANQTQRLYIFWIEKNAFKVWDVPQIEKLAGYVMGLRNAIHFRNDQAYLKTAHPLFAQLFPKQVPKRIAQLIIVPDAMLNRIPFDALLTEAVEDERQGYAHFPYLLKKWRVSYAYSATLFTQLIQKRGAPLPLRILLCAPVQFEAATELRATLEEVNLIANLCASKSWEVNKLTYQQANESLIKSGALKNTKILHFATHGRIDENTPELSRIYLAAHAPSGEDGLLYNGEIFNLDLGEAGAELATLSACQTGMGAFSKGEGIMGITRAFFYAGVKKLLVSLWSVHDEATAVIMTEFYQAYLNSENPDYATALHEAKRCTIERGYAPPYFWAAFILIGE